MLPLLITLRDMANAGRKLMLPLLNREIPLICDEWAKPELGTGCVKITPAHDPNDYEVGKRQNLPMINILNPDGTLNDNAGPYKGLTIPKARDRVVADLDKLGLARRRRRPRNRAAPLRPQQDADRAVLGRSVVREDGRHSDDRVRARARVRGSRSDCSRARPNGDGRRDQTAASTSSPRATPRAISTGSAKNATGPSAGSSGGDIEFRFGSTSRSDAADTATMRLRNLQVDVDELQC